MGMKIKIKLKKNWQQIDVKPYNDLTLSEYRKLLDILAVHGEIGLMDYLSVTTKHAYRAVMGAEIKGDHRLNHLGILYFCKGLGESKKGLSYIEDEKVNKIFRYKGKLYDFKDINYRARGYRVILNQYINSKPNYLDLYSFCLAMMLDNTFDFENIERIQKELEGYNYYKVLTLGAFFFSNITSGRNFVTIGLQKLTKRLLTWTLK